MTTRHFFIILLSACFIFFTSCTGNKQKSETDQILVVSSFSILSDMIQQIGKDSIQVYNLVPTGIDPHEYELTPEDVKVTSKADLLFYNGLNLEGGKNGWFQKMIDALQVDPHRVFSASKNVQPQYIGDHKENKEVNPHAFIDPNVGMEMAKNIGEALISIDEKNKEYYEKNTTEYIEELKDIEEQYREKFESIPAEQRVFMASEQAFQYLLNRYDFKEGYIWSIDTEENGSSEQIKKAIQFVEEHRPKVLFLESNVDPRPMRTVSKSTGVPIYPEVIYSDELSKSKGKASTYTDYLLYNLEHIYKGLSTTDEQ